MPSLEAKSMQIFQFRNAAPASRQSVLTIGNFDGVHLGHQALIGRVVEEARKTGAQSALLTFDPHPQTVLSERQVPALTSLKQRISLFEGLGLEAVYLIPFTRQLAKKSAEEFVREFLIDRFRLRRVVMGYDFAFGRNREGTATVMEALSGEFGFAYEVFPAVAVDGQIVSSSRIRRVLESGEFRLAERLLGRPFSILGLVVQGERRGQKLGFPTMNVVPELPLALRRGVYAVKTRVGEGVYGGVCNYGVRPTVGAAQPILETHLFDFDLTGEGYGETIEVMPLRFLREERAFASLDDLRAQIARDSREARAFLEQARTS